MSKFMEILKKVGEEISKAAPGLTNAIPEITHGACPGPNGNGLRDFQRKRFRSLRPWPTDDGSREGDRATGYAFDRIA